MPAFMRHTNSRAKLQPSLEGPIEVQPAVQRTSVIYANTFALACAIACSGCAASSRRTPPSTNARATTSFGALDAASTADASASGDADADAVDSSAAPDAARVPTQAEVNELRDRLPASVGLESVRALVAQNDADLATALDEASAPIQRAFGNETTVLDRWSRIVSNARSHRTLRSYVALLEEGVRRGGLAHRPADVLEEYEVLPLVALAIGDAALQDVQRRAQRYGDTVSTIHAGDMEWNRIRETARWAAERLERITMRLGSRPGPAGMRVRDAYGPWLLESGRVDEAARMLGALTHAPGHDTPGWRYLIARAFEAAGQPAEADRTLAGIASPARYEPQSERMARLRLRAARLERETRGATDAEHLRARVWALLVLGRNGDALRTVQDAPAPANTDPAVVEARAVALAVDGASGAELWSATEQTLPGTHEGYDAVRVHAGFARLRPWQFPRRLDDARWSPADPGIVAELRTRLGRIHLAAGQRPDPLAWQLDLLTLPASPNGLGSTAAGRALLATLDRAIRGNDKALQLYAATMAMILHACSGDSRAGSAAVDAIRPDPEHADDAASVRAMALALRALLEPSQATCDALYGEVSRRAEAERGYTSRLVSTALLYDALALARYEAITNEATRDDGRAAFRRAVQVAADELDARLDSATISQGLIGPVYLQGAALATSDWGSLGYLSRASTIWAQRFGRFVTGVQRAWAGRPVPAMDAFEMCANGSVPPTIAARCASWRASLGRDAGESASQRTHWEQAAARFADGARAIDGPTALGAAHANDIVPVAIVTPRTEIDLETWRLRHQWIGSVGWLFAPAR
jgi:hypothetical protein